MKSGTIVLVSGRDTQARIIQKFQQLTDKEAGRFNHSGLILNLNGKDYILEMSYIRNRKTRAACVIRPLTVYQDGKHELLFLHPKLFYNAMDFEALALSFTGTPYSYSKLLINIPRSILFNRVTDPKDKRPDRYFGDKDNERQLVCHMLSQLVWHRFVADGIFPRWYSGDVAELYWSPDFERVEG